MAKDRSGYVYQDKQGAWYARTTITNVSGKRRNIKRRAKDKSDAKDTLKIILRQLDDEGSKVVDAARMTFNDLADYYETHYLKPAEYVDGRRVAGLRDVQRAKGFLVSFREYFGKRRLRDITYGDIHTYRAERLQTPTQYKRPPTIASMNREFVVLRRILNIGVREGWLQRNPFNAGDPLIDVSAERMRERILTLDEERRLLDACGHPKRSHLRPLLICLLDTGARKSEMLKLRWSDVDFVARTITIQAMTTKTLKTRQVAMTTRMYHELLQLWEASSKAPDARVLGITDNVRRSFSSACKIAGIKEGGIDGLTLHALRHTAATRLVKGQMPLQMVGRILGHSQPQTTYRYLSTNSETAQQAAAIFDSYAEAMPGAETYESPEMIQ